MDKTTIDSAVDAMRASVDDAYRQGLERAWKLAQFVCTDVMEHLYECGLNPYGPRFKYDGDADTSDIGEFEYSCCVIAHYTVAEVLERLSPQEYTKYQKTESAEALNIKPLPSTESVGESFIKDVEAGLKKLDEATEQIKEETVCHCNRKSNADLIATILDCDSNNCDFRDNVCDNCGHKLEAGEISACNDCEQMSCWVKKPTTLPVGTIVVTTVDKDYAGCEVFPVGTIGRVVRIAMSTMCELPYLVEAIPPKDETHHFWYSADTLRVVPESVITALCTEEGT